MNVFGTFTSILAKSKAAWGWCEYLNDHQCSYEGRGNWWVLGGKHNGHCGSVTNLHGLCLTGQLLLLWGKFPHLLVEAKGWLVLHQEQANVMISKGVWLWGLNRGSSCSRKDVAVREASHLVLKEWREEHSRSYPGRCVPIRGPAESDSQQLSWDCWLGLLCWWCLYHLVYWTRQEAPGDSRVGYDIAWGSEGGASVGQLRSDPESVTQEECWIDLVDKALLTPNFFIFQMWIIVPILLLGILRFNIGK